MKKHDRVIWNNKKCIIWNVLEDGFIIKIMSNDPIESMDFIDIKVKVDEIELYYK